jgi:hypothetical protein
VATALVGGTPISVSLILTSLGIGFGAAGGYQAIKDLLPLILKLVGVGFGSSDKALADAEKAGQEAGEKPTGGIGSVVPIKDITAGGYIGRPSAEMKRQTAEKLQSMGYEQQPDGSWKPKGDA